MEFPTHDIAKNVYGTLNGSPIPGTTRNFKLNWATHGSGGLKTTTSTGGMPGGSGGPTMQ